MCVREIYQDEEEEEEEEEEEGYLPLEQLLVFQIWREGRMRLLAY